MKLTRKQREWLRDVKKRAERDYAISLDGRTRYNGDGMDHGFKQWESWRLADLCLKLAGVKDK